MGWSQGCTLRIGLPLGHFDLVDEATFRTEEPHDLWLVADQDCDLAWRALVGADAFLVELRPVYTHDPPSDWGIRSQQFRLNEAGMYLQANSPALRVTPALVHSAEHAGCLDIDSQTRLKTWLGMRYDRPAIPQRYIELARAIASEIRKKRNRPQGARVRDVLAHFADTPTGGTEYSLFAVVPNETTNSGEADDSIRVWLSEIALKIPQELGYAVSLEAYSDQEISLAFVEGSYSLDLSALSWPTNTPGPTGAI